MTNLELIEYAREKESELEAVKDLRVEDEFKANTFSFRTNADVDYSRILYSSSFRRLQGKMQLFIPKSQVFYRNRLTHSYEVAQIAKTIAKKLQLQDIITPQTVSLAHDLGNPPFGHAGEIILDKISKERYEGNAQTFRILRRLEERHYDFNGLNLTIRTMLGIVKYYEKASSKSKKFLYNKDYDLVKKWIEDYDINYKTIDCEIMDLSDEIAYAVHDLEDALKLKYFTLDELLYEFSIHDEFKDVVRELKKVFIRAKEFASKSHVYKTSEEYAMLLRKELTSQLTSMFILDVDLIKGKLGFKEYGKLVKGLKKLTFHAIKRQPDIMEYEQLGKSILTKLFHLYMDKDFNKDMLLMPANYRIPDKWERKVLDYLGGMMDIYAIRKYEKYFGKIKNGVINYEQLLPTKNIVHLAESAKNKDDSNK